MKKFLLFMLPVFAWLSISSCAKNKHYTVSGIVVSDSLPQTLAGRKVEIYYQHCATCADKKGEMSTDALGRFSFSVKAPMSYIIKCTHLPDSTYGVASLSGDEQDYNIVLVMRKTH